MTALIIIEGVVIILLLVLTAGLLKSHAEILRSLDRLESNQPRPPDAVGMLPRTTGLGRVPSPVVSGVDPAGSAVAVSVEQPDGEILLAFLSSGCSSCRVFWSSLGTGTELPTPKTRPMIVTKGPASESAAKIADLAPDGVSIVMSDEAWDSFRVPLTPYFVLVGPGGQILGEGSATAMDRLLDLFRQAALDAGPMTMGTSQREALVDRRLRDTGVEPGHPSLYEDPLG